MTSIPPGWYRDPTVPAALRYWDGAAWTAHRHAVVSPVDRPEEGRPPGTSWNTVWIWLVVLMLVLPMLSLFTPWDTGWEYDFLAPGAVGRPHVQFLTDLLELTSGLLGYVTYGLAVFFAYRDYRVLRERGVPKPFHWAWAFLTPVYPIGRSVVVVRRIGRGWAPLWATIGALALALVVAGMIVVVLLTAMADLHLGT